jgi:hypothetical protein
MKSKNKGKGSIEKSIIAPFTRRTLYPRPICLEKATMNIPRGYEEDILMTLRAFSNETSYMRKTPHNVGGDTMSLDVKSRHDKYRMLYYIEKETGVCKITNLCTEETHRG